MRLKVFGYRSNDQVLGTGAYIAYFKGDGAEAQIVRTVFGLDAVAANKVALQGPRRAGAGRTADRVCRG
ncbi:MAG: hypothetical protein ACRDTA_07505 [Pseudonocardiaceae bacterium]